MQFVVVAYSLKFYFKIWVEFQDNILLLVVLSFSYCFCYLTITYEPMALNAEVF